MVCVTGFTRSIVAGLSVIACYAGVVSADKPRDFKPSDFAGPVYHEASGFVIAECEGAPYTSKWLLQTDKGDPNNPGGCVTGDLRFPTGGSDGNELNYQGTGYLKWVGEKLSNGLDGDPTQDYQGDHRDWLVFKMWITHSGLYSVDVRSFHHLRDGDNDMWIGCIGKDTLVYKFGNCHVRQYTWHDWDPDKCKFYLSQGLNAVYITGRSRGVGVDRVAIFQSGVDSSFRRSHDPKVAPTALFDSNAVSVLNSFAWKTGESSGTGAACSGFARSVQLLPGPAIFIPRAERSGPLIVRIDARGRRSAVPIVPSGVTGSRIPIQK